MIKKILLVSLLFAGNNLLGQGAVTFFPAVGQGPQFSGNGTGSSSSSGGGGAATNLFNTTQFETNNGITQIKSGAITTNLEAASLNRTNNSFYSLSYTNVGGIDTLLYNVPVSAQTNSGDYLIGIMSPTPVSSSCGGFFFPLFGTNKTYNNYTGTAWSVLPSGQTNYLYDQKAMAINGNGANNILDINGGCAGIFLDPHWPFYIGGFSPNSGEADWLYQDPTNWTVHFPTVKAGSNIDPRTGGAGSWDALTIDERQGNVTISNLTVKSQVLITATGADLVTNYPQLTIKQTSSGWGPNIVLDASASASGRSFGLNSTGFSDPAGAGFMAVYDYTLGDYIFYLGGTNHNLAIPRGGVTTITVLATNTITASNFVQSANATNGNIVLIGTGGSFTNTNMVSTAQMGTGTANSTRYLSGARTWLVTPLTVTVTGDSTGLHQDGGSANFSSGSVSVQLGDLAPQSANTVFGNATGSSAAPTFVTVPVTLGHSTLRTNQFTIAATGYTNTQTYNQVAYPTGVAVAITHSDGTNVIQTVTVSTGASFVLHPSYKITAASGLGGVVIAQ